MEKDVREYFQKMIKESHSPDSYLLDIDNIPDIGTIKGIAKKLKAYSEIRNEMFTIDGWLKSIKNKLEGSEKSNDNNAQAKATFDIAQQKGIWFASVIIYGKAFVGGHRSNLSNKKQDIFRGQDDLKKTHEEILGYRHGYIAHAGEKNMELSKTPLFISLKKGEKEILDVASFYFRLEGLGTEKYHEFQRLVQHVHNWVFKEIKKLKTSLLQEIKEKIDIDELYKCELIE